MCGLTNAFTRFLFACIDFPHTFWDENGARVDLSDVERQLIENGIALLTKMECPPMNLLVTDYASPNNDVIPSGALETKVTLGSGLLLPSHVVSPVLPGTIDIVTPGLYRFDYRCRVHGGLSPTTDWNHQAKLRVNGNLVDVDTRRRLEAYSTLQTYYMADFSAGDRLEFIYEQFAGEDVTLHSSFVRVRGVYLG